MLITGSPFSDVLTYLTLVLPLLSVCFILFGKEYTDDSSTMVMILCLFYFVQRLLLLYNNLMEFSFPLVENLFNLVEFILLVFLLRASFPELKSHYILNLFVIAYFSSIITYYTVRGFESDQFELKIIQYGLIVLLMIASLILMARNQALTMLNSSLFWVTLGTLFYFSFCVFWETGKRYIFSPGDKNSTELGAFPLIMMAIRFVFYVLAMSLAQTGEKPQRVFYDDQIPELQVAPEELPSSYTIMNARDVPGERIL